MDDGEAAGGPSNLELDVVMGEGANDSYWEDEDDNDLSWEDEEFFLANNDKDHTNDPNKGEDSEDTDPPQDEDMDTNADEDHRVDLPKWSQDTVQTDEMARLGICVNTVARVIVCLECRTAVNPSDLHAHIAKNHPSISTTPTVHEGLVETFNLDPKPVGTRPGSIVTAIYGLELVRGYRSCDDCGYACKVEKRLKEHMKQDEGCRSYSERLVQTYQPKSNRMYFGVAQDPPGDSDEDPLDPIGYLKKKYVPAPFSLLPIQSVKNPKERNPFLNMERWDEYIQGKSGADLHFLLRERVPELRQEVRVCMERFVSKGARDLADTDHESRAAVGDYIG